MIKINLVAVGKVKEKYFSEGIDEYAKRLSRFCDFNIIEVKEEAFTSPSEAEINLIKKREAERILPKLRGKVFCLAIEGKIISSENLSEIIGKSSANFPELTFVIGGSYGLDGSVKEKGELISLGKATFPHTLFRLIMTEQLYRAFTILSGTAYHK